MGTWGHRSFDNDGAVDWVQELENEGIAAIRHALGAVARAKASADIDVDDAQFAIAAAEVVAAARGHAGKGLPDVVHDWLDADMAAITARDAARAHKAVVRVRDKSELAELWAEHGAENPWQSEVGRLLARLASPPKTRPRRAKTEQQRPAPSEPPPYRVVDSPDGSIRATALVIDGTCTITIDALVVLAAGGGGDSMFAAACGLVGMRRVNAAAARRCARMR